MGRSGFMGRMGLTACIGRSGLTGRTPTGFFWSTHGMTRSYVRFRTYSGLLVMPKVQKATEGLAEGVGPDMRKSAHGLVGLDAAGASLWGRFVLPGQEPWSRSVVPLDRTARG